MDTKTLSPLKGLALLGIAAVLGVGVVFALIHFNVTGKASPGRASESSPPPPGQSQQAKPPVKAPALAVEITGPAAPAVQFANWVVVGPYLDGDMKYLHPMNVRFGGRDGPPGDGAPNYITFVAYHGSVKVSAGKIVPRAPLSPGDTGRVSALGGIGADADRVVLTIDFMSAEDRAKLQGTGLELKVVDDTPAPVVTSEPVAAPKPTAVSNLP
jgi:hypothetical protein